MNAAADLERLARESGWSDRIAYHTPERDWTHGEVHDLAARAATVLAEHGLARGARLLIVLPDEVAWVAMFLAAARLGAVAVPISPWLTADDHRSVATDCAATLVVSHPGLGDRFDADRRIDVTQILRKAEVAAPAPACEVPSDAPLYVQYTSGTTGEPKGAVHRHADLAAYHRTAGIAALGITRDDTALSVSKLFFAYGFGNSFVYPLHSGSAAVLMPGRPGADIAGPVRKYGVTVLYAVPSAYANLVADADRAAFASVRVAVSAGEPLSRTLCERVTELLGAPVLDGLGSTEVGGFCCMNTVRENRPGTVGRPLPGYELRLRDDAGRPVADEAEGRLWVRGPTVLTEYLGRPEETAAGLADGWLATGDRAVRHADGTYTMAGRIDDMELVGGITLAPLEVERVLGEHPAVAEVAVAAVPDERGATRLNAFVVPRAADGPPDGLAGELTVLARRRLAAHKVPRAIRFVDALPRTATGKIRRFVLRGGSW